jgi:hypothetical protein
LQKRIFQRVFDLAEIARFTPDEARIYEESLKHYRDLNNVINSAERRRKAEGREEGRMEAKFEDALYTTQTGLQRTCLASPSRPGKFVYEEKYIRKSDSGGRR